MALFKFAKKEKEPQYEMSLMNNKMLNYKTYRFSAPELILNILVIFILGGFILRVFYSDFFKVDGEKTGLTEIVNWLIFVAGGLIGLIFLLPGRQDAKRKKRQNTLRLQFREFLAALTASFSAGANMQNAFESASKELHSQFGEKAYISQEIREIIKGIYNSIDVEDLLENFAERSGVEEIKDFASIFRSTYRRGGDIKSVVRNSYNLIGDKITINEEIRTKLTSNKMQLNFMTVVPVLIILFMRFSSSTFADSFSSFSGVVAMTIAIVIFIIAILLGKKITDINV